jgi:hypothetical protein
VTQAFYRVENGKASAALAVIGKVPESKRVGDAAWFRAEIGDEAIIQKVLRGYLTHVSVQVDSDEVECSKCHKQSRARAECWVAV